MAANGSQSAQNLTKIAASGAKLCETAAKVRRIGWRSAGFNKRPRGSRQKRAKTQQKRGELAPKMRI